MNPEQIIASVSGLVALVAGATAFVKTRSAANATAVSNAVEAAAATAAQKINLSALLDKRYADSMKRQDDEIERQDAEIENLRRDLKKVPDLIAASTRETTQVKETVKRWFYVLREWDLRGRRGPMPLPSDADMHLLELDPNLENTLGQQEAAAAVESHRQGLARPEQYG